MYNTQRIDHIYDNPHIADSHIHLHYGDLSESTNLIRIILEAQPDENFIFHAIIHVYVSFYEPE